MSEEQYKIETKFLDSLGYGVLSIHKKEAMQTLSKFKTYLIEQGEHVTTISQADIIGKIMKESNEMEMQYINRIKELEKEVQQHRDNAFKVVSYEEIKEWADKEGFSGACIYGRIQGAKWMQDKLTGKV